MSRRRRRMGRGSGVIPDVDALIQALIDGAYNGGTAKAWKAATAGTTGGFPHPESDTELAEWTLAGSGSATLVDSTHAALHFTSNDATVLARSAYTDAKYLTIEKTGKPTVFLSIGTSSFVGGVDAAFGADAQFSNPASTSLDWFVNDTVTISTATVAAVDETIADFAVTPSTTSPVGGGSYTATAQAKNASDADVHRIGISLTPSVVTVSGTGGGSTSTSSAVTNAYGLSETIDLTAGTYPTTETVHVTDGTITGDSADIVVQSSIQLLGSVTAASVDAGSGTTTAARDLTGIDVSLITIVAAGYGDTPAVSDSAGNTWTLRKSSPNGYLALYECVSPTVTAAQTFFGGSPAQFTSLAVQWWSNVDSTPDDDENSNSGTGAIASGIVAPAVDNELVLAALWVGAASTGLGLDSGFTVAVDTPFVSGESIGIGAGYLVEAAKANKNPLWSGIDASNASQTVIATYKRAP